jgi:hypothetical protein
VGQLEAFVQVELVASCEQCLRVGASTWFLARKHSPYLTIMIHPGDDSVKLSFLIWLEKTKNKNIEACLLGLR